MSNENDKESDIDYSSDSSDSFKPPSDEGQSSSTTKRNTKTAMGTSAIGGSQNPADESNNDKNATATTTGGITNPVVGRDPDLADLQRVDAFLQQLPYFEQTKRYAFKAFDEIKRNLAESIIRNEIRPGFTHWTNQLIVFVHEYGLFFTKEDHLQLIKLFLSVAQTPEIDLPTIDFCFSTLHELLKKYDRISRKDLKIDWRPIYNIYLRFHKVNECTAELVPDNIESGSFSNFIRYARIYFDENSTSEMLAEWRPLVCPFDSSMAFAFERFKIFLPTVFLEHELKSGYNLWLNEFMNLWTSLDNRQHWESYLLALLSRVACDNLGEIDWTPYIPFIFSNVLKGFGLPFGSKDSIALGVSNTINSFNLNMSQIFVYQSEDVLNMCSLIVSMIGCGRDGNDRNVCMQHIKRLFLALRSFFYPSNTGSWSSNLFLFLKCLPEALIKRIKKEKREKSKWFHRTVERENMISNTDVTEFVEAMKSVVFTAIFSKSNHSDAKKAFQYLTFLRGEIMLPPLIDMIYVSLESLTEPHRYTSILSVVVAVSREIATYNRFHKDTQTQMHVIALMTAVLPGLDPNDANKCLLTLHYLYNTISCIVLCDCSPAINYRNDLTETERELCFETSKFEDFIHEFFKRVFYIVDILASDISADSSASAAAASNQFGISKSNNENIYQAQLIQTLRVLVRQSSKNILKIISNKLKNYINGNTFNTRAGRILANVIGFLCCVKSYGATAFETFFNYCYENLSKIRDSKTFETFKNNERGDIEVSWNLQLFSEILKAHGTILLPHMTRICQVISWYRETIHKETISYISNSYRNVIHSLSTIYPIETASVPYDFVFDDEKEFFTNHLPIRDWAATTDVFHLDVSYHLPSTKELETVIDFVDASLNESIGILKRAIHDNEPSKKEDRNRELNYMNHIIFGASRLLKRPAEKIVSSLIETSVKIGIPDEANKGLGFETPLLDDETHEYNKLSDRHKKILLTTRKTVCEFLIDLTDKVNEKFANETPLLMLITRILCASSVVYGFFVAEFEKAWKNFYSNKSSLQNRLLGKKNSLRPELIYRVMLQYQYRTFYVHTRLNELDKRIIDVLFRLSTDSIYAIVRRDAQSQLFSLLAHFPYSTSVIVPGLVGLLRAHNEETDAEAKSARHDQLKGCLYLLLGNSVQDSLMIKQNWSILSVLWPQVFKCQSFEKPSIQSLLEKIHAKTDKDFDSFDNRVQFGDELVKLALHMARLDTHNNNNNLTTVDGTNRLERFELRVANETAMIAGLLDQLLKIAKQQSLLHWKNQANSFHAILFLLHNCVRTKSLLSAELVQLFVDSLLSENANVRKISIDGLCIILKTTKPRKKTRSVSTREVLKQKAGLTDPEQIYINRARPGIRADNQWHLFDANFIDTSTSEVSEAELARWSEACFIEKNYWGYYCWPQELDMAESRRDWYSIDTTATNNTNLDESSINHRYQSAMKPIIDKFSKDPAFVNKFVQLAIIEESKGDEKFDKKRFYLFKALFRNFGTTDIVHSLFDLLHKLVADKDTNTHECSHKLAAEIVSGLIRGSKSWPLGRLKPLWSQFRPLLDKIVDNMSTDTVKLWYNCFSNSFEDQDPRRLCFFLNYFAQLTTRMFATNVESKEEASTSTNDSTSSVATGTSSFQQSSTLQFLLAFNQFEWKIPQFWNSLIDVFMRNMSHPYKSIREKNSSCLCLAHVTELDVSAFASVDASANEIVEIGKLNSQSLLIKLAKFIEDRLRKDIELFDFINEDSMDTGSGANGNNNGENNGNKKSEQHQSAVNFLQSVFAWFGYFILKSYQPINDKVLQLLPQLCSVDKIAAQEVTVKSQLAMSRMAISMWILKDECSKILMGHLDKIIEYKSWHSRLAALQILQNFGIFNIFLVKENIRELVKKIVVNSLIDEQLEVRIAASLALTGFIHSHFITVDNDLINHLKTLSKTKAKKKDKESDKMVINLLGLVKRHGGILGLCSIVNSHPYDVPSYLPDVLTYLCQFTNDPVPIQGSVRKCLSEFRRTHHDNWQEHKLSFDESQLSTLADILISPNYYA